MSRKKYRGVIDHLVVFNDSLYMEDSLHRMSKPILDKILDNLKKIASKHTHDEIAELCKTSPETITRILNKKRGANPERFTLNMALKLWEGLGHAPETLIADCNVDPLLARKIKQIQQGEYARLLNLLVNILCDLEYVDDLRELAKVEGYLEAIWDRIVKLKDQQPAGPGAKLSNSGGI